MSVNLYANTVTGHVSTTYIIIPINVLLSIFGYFITRR